MDNYFESAFKSIQFLNEEDVELDKINMLDDILDDEEETEEETQEVIDLDAETEEEVADPEVGDVILQCSSCKSVVYMGLEELKELNDDLDSIQEEEGCVSIGEPCPHCHQEDACFEVIGQVAPFESETEVEVEVDGEPVDVALDIDDEEEEKEDEDKEKKKEESLKRRNAKKKLKESLNEQDDTDYEESLEEVTFTSEELKEAIKSSGYKGNANILYNRICKDVKAEGFNSKATSITELVEEYVTAINESIQKRSNARRAKLEDFKAADITTSDDQKISITAVGGEQTDDLMIAPMSDETMQELEEPSFEEPMEEPAPEEPMGMEEPEMEEEPIEGEEDEEGEEKEESFKKHSFASKDSKYLDEGILEDEDIQAQIDELEERIQILVRKYAAAQERNHGDSSESKRIEANIDELENKQERLKDKLKSRSTEESLEVRDVELEDFDSDTFSKLAEQYLKKIYENVKSFKMTNAIEKDNSLVLEGLIKFNSGNSKKTQFCFKSNNLTESNRANFVGSNKAICNGSKAFTLSGRIENGEFICESLNYNYRAKDTTGKSQRVYGTIKATFDESLNEGGGHRSKDSRYQSRMNKRVGFDDIESEDEEPKSFYAKKSDCVDCETEELMSEGNHRKSTYYDYEGNYGDDDYDSSDDDSNDDYYNGDIGDNYYMLGAYEIEPDSYDDMDREIEKELYPHRFNRDGSRKDISKNYTDDADAEDEDEWEYESYTESKEPMEPDSARELALYISNDSDLYKRRITPVIDNLAKKMAKGVYNKELAVKAFKHVADEGAKKYQKEFADPDDTHYIFNVATREETAKQLRDEYEEEIKEKSSKYKKDESYNESKEFNKAVTKFKGVEAPKQTTNKGVKGDSYKAKPWAPVANGKAIVGMYDKSTKTFKDVDGKKVTLSVGGIIYDPKADKYYRFDGTKYTVLKK